MMQFLLSILITFTLLSSGIAAQAKNFDARIYDQLEFDDQTPYGLALTEAQQAMYQVLEEFSEAPKYELELSQFQWLHRELSICKPKSASDGCISNAKARAQFIEQVWPKWKALAVLSNEVHLELPSQLQARFEKMQSHWWSQFLKKCNSQKNINQCELLANKRFGLLQDTYQVWNEANVASTWLKGEQAHLASIEEQLLKQLKGKAHQHFNSDRSSFQQELKVQCYRQKRVRHSGDVQGQSIFRVFKNHRCEAALLKERAVRLDERLENIAALSATEQQSKCYDWIDELTTANTWLTLKSQGGVRLARGEVCLSIKPENIRVDIFYSGYDSNMCSASYDFRAIEGVKKMQSKFIRYVHSQYDKVSNSFCLLEARFTPNTIHLSSKNDVCRTLLDGCGDRASIPDEIPLWLPSKPWNPKN